MKSIRFSETVNYYLEASTRLNKPAAPESFCCLGWGRDGVITICFFLEALHCICTADIGFSTAPTSVTLWIYEWECFQQCFEMCQSSNPRQTCLLVSVPFLLASIHLHWSAFQRICTLQPKATFFVHNLSVLFEFSIFVFGPAQILYFGSFHKRMQKTSTAFANVKNPYFIWTTCFCLIKYTHEFDPTKLFFWRNLETINTCQR